MSPRKKKDITQLGAYQEPRTRLLDLSMVVHFCEMVPDAFFADIVFTESIALEVNHRSSQVLSWNN